MKAIRALVPAAALVALLLSGCSEKSVVPAPRPSPAPQPTQPPPSPRPAADWPDMPQTPGNWTWAMEGSQSVARFANGALVLACDRASATVTLSRPGIASGPVAMTVMTGTAKRPVTGNPREGTPPTIVAGFAARDPLLDAMAFSRGRFAVETTGLETLYVPSWPEVSRVIEDCR